MKKHLIALTVSAVFGMLAACSDVKFNKTEGLSCQGAGSGACISQNGIDTFPPIVRTFTGGKVDILFVDDNSASMSYEQTKIAQRFSDFIAKLDARGVDYRIAITTTDVSSASGLKGRLVTFGDGSKYITPATANRVGLFSGAISRPETATCENFIRNAMNTGGQFWQSSSSYINNYDSQCPSSDERGVYAANMTILNNFDSFLRSDSNLSVILISDEDARSAQAYPLESLDLPATFAANMTSKYPSKAWNFHSIIVLDVACQTQQSQQSVDPYGRQVVLGSVGHTYAKFNLEMRDELNRPRGVLGDICSNDYATPLVANVATNILDRLDEVMLNCANPVELVVSPSTITYTRSGRLLKINPRPNAGTVVTITHKCKTIDSL